MGNIGRPCVRYDVLPLDEPMTVRSGPRSAPPAAAATLRTVPDEAGLAEDVPAGTVSTERGPAEGAPVESGPLAGGPVAVNEPCRHGGE